MSDAPSDELVEAVAGAMWQHHRIEEETPAEFPWAEYANDKSPYLSAARAAITAYRKATAGEPRHEVRDKSPNPRTSTRE